MLHFGAVYSLLPAAMRSKEADVMLWATMLQESGGVDRVQKPRRPGGPAGPARGLWQFEQGGGVLGVLQHESSGPIARAVCRARGLRPKSYDVWAALARDDVLAGCFARLLLWTDPAPLPGLGDEAVAWAYYERNWRPGAPHPDRWPGNYAKALEWASLS